MILEYSYDKGNMILDYFKQSKIASLEIKTVKEKIPNGETAFVMEYTLVDDYPEPRQSLIREVLQNSLQERLQLANVLNKFIENQILNNVKNFSLKFNTVKVRKCEISYSFSYKQQTEENKMSSTDELVQCLERLDRIITEMGAGGHSTANIYKKEGAGRNKKYIPLTVQDVANTLRQSLVEG